MSEDAEERERNWLYLNDCWRCLYYQERALRLGGMIVVSVRRDYSRVRAAQMALGLEEKDMLQYERLTIDSCGDRGK